MMRQLISAGIITFYQKQDEEQLYLLLHYPHGHWDLSKGKMESNETKEQTAIRELREETGLKAQIISGFETSYSYVYTEKDGIVSQKTVYFFVGKASIQEVVLSHEHQDYAWLPYDQALQQLTFENTKKVLHEAEEFLQKLYNFR
jgi:bis(5'-nucleosidyl)-tetraphosphatase